MKPIRPAYTGCKPGLGPQVVPSGLSLSSAAFLTLASFSGNWPSWSGRLPSPIPYSYSVSSATPVGKKGIVFPNSFTTNLRFESQWFTFGHMPIPRNKGNEILMPGVGRSDVPKPCGLRMGKGGSSGCLYQKREMDVGETAEGPHKIQGKRDEVVSSIRCFWEKN